MPGKPTYEEVEEEVVSFKHICRRFYTPDWVKD